MITISVIAFREFLEAFLIVGVFFGISKKLSLGREKEIGFAAFFGFVISLILATLTYFFGDHARSILTEERAEILEGYLLIFSGGFLAYVVVSLHNIISRDRGAKLLKAHQKLQSNAFDISLFATIVMLVVREGFEIALFTASTSLFSVFLQNFLGLIIGFMGASVFGVLTYFTYLKFALSKVFKLTEYMIILLGAAFVQNGITEILEHSFGIEIDTMVRLAIMLMYFAIIYWLFMRQKNAPISRQV